MERPMMNVSDPQYRSSAGDTVPTVGGILESALYVEDVERSAAFYERLFGPEPDGIRDR